MAYIYIYICVCVCVCVCSLLWDVGQDSVVGIVTHTGLDGPGSES